MGLFKHGRHALRSSVRLVPVVLVAALALAPANRAVAQGAVKSVHKDWQIRCDTPPGSKTEQCALIQSVTAEDRANVGLTVIVLKTADASRLMRGSAAGVLLPSVLGSRSSGRHRRPPRYCLPSACEVVMDDELIKKPYGKAATFITDPGGRHVSDEPSASARYDKLP